MTSTFVGHPDYIERNDKTKQKQGEYQPPTYRVPSVTTMTNYKEAHMTFALLGFQYFRNRQEAPLESAALASAADSSC